MKKILKRALAVLLSIIMLCSSAPTAGILSGVLGATTALASEATSASETLICKTVCKFQNYYFVVEGQQVYRYDLNLGGKTEVANEGPKVYRSLLSIYRNNLYLSSDENSAVMKYNMERNCFEILFEESGAYSSENTLAFCNDYMVIQGEEKVSLLNLNTGVVETSFDGDLLSVSGNKILFQSINYTYFYLCDSETVDE